MLAQIPWDVWVHNIKHVQTKSIEQGKTSILLEMGQNKKVHNGFSLLPEKRVEESLFQHDHQQPEYQHLQIQTNSSDI
mgnify:CR=1 FL=1